jgi:diguanylate cyclase (GGDEF)-like protein
VGWEKTRPIAYTVTVEPESEGLKVDGAFLDQLNYLRRTGALDDLDLLRNENRVLDALINDAAALFTLNSVEKMLDFVIARILGQFIPTHLAILIEPPRGEALKQYCYVNLKPSDERLAESSFARIREYFLESPYPVAYEDLEAKGRGDDGLLRFDPALLFPMCGIGGPFGVALLGRKIVGTPYTDLERMYVDKFMRFLSIGIQNNLLHESSITDAKTGLFNHAFFTQRLEQEISHVDRHGAKAGIIMLDVDHFKKFNDEWGHLAGDEVLNALAIALKRTVRSEDVASRFGGEEFCVLAMECDRARLMEMAERIRTAIEATKVPYKSHELSVTASLGCCIIDRGLGLGSAGYIEMADKALYLSKSGGRNRSTLYRPGLLDRAAAIRKRPRKI